MNASTDRTGYVAIVGRPNVGKSTLLNHILGTKLSITSRKPQTTRQRILGIYTIDNTQMIFVDTPGMHELHKGADNEMNRYMNQQAIGILREVDLCLHVIDAAGWLEADQRVVQHLEAAEVERVFCVLNKVDQIHPKSRIIPVLEEASKQYNYQEIIPISALKNRGLDIVVEQLAKWLPAQPKMFPDDEITDRSLRFLVGEMLREKVVRQLGDELPYRTAVAVENYTDEENITHIDAVIYVEKTSQKGIVIGKGGERLKSIGTAARKSIELLLERQVFLNLLVKTRPGWTDERVQLAALGYQ
ncbi:MAG: GTPase Era [Gammaproteobacteria bacterium]|nr:GTPase Era [Gammaproteobacteria bacterium]MYC24817.1 GTPase Era [Gammaproteobacteria bacterium]